MLKHYLRVTFRHLLRRKGYTFINVTGLAVGVAACLLILLYVRHERSYDRFHEKADRIYRIAWFSARPQTRTPHPMAQALVRDFPEVEAAVSLSPIWGPGLTRPTFSVRYEDLRFDETEIFSADSTFFDVFSFPLLRGDPKTALTVPGGILLTESAAARYFGAEDPIGKVLRVNEQVDLTVTGVLADLPAESHFHFDFLVSYVTMKMGDQSAYYEWEDFGHYNYIVLAEGADPKVLEARLETWARRYIDAPEEEWAAYRAGLIGFRLQPLTDIHLHSHLMWELEPNSHAAYLYTFSAAAVFILLIACINFMNLSTARAMDRAKEVGVRKVAGADRRQLAVQFLGEALLLSVLATIGAVLLVLLSLPAFRMLSGVDLRADFTSPVFWGVLAAGVFGVGVLAGSYPAFVLSAFRPVQVLKGTFKASPSGQMLRQVLVVFQFALSIALIIGTLVVYRQLHYLRTADLGFESEQVVVLPLRESARPQYEALKEALGAHPNVLSSSAVSNVPGGRFNQNSIRWEGDDETVNALELRVDHDFLETLGIELVAGRGFSRAYPTDVRGALIVNEAAARHAGGAEAVGKELEWFVEGGTRRGEVVGVMKDFHFQSLRDAIVPLVVEVNPGALNYLLVRIRPVAIGATLGFLEQTWKQFHPSYTFTYSFLGRDLDALYRAEAQMGRILGAFSGLALLIACLGLFGLATFAAEQRRKEIGVRKVLGATAASIVVHLSKDFTALVALAFVVAAPLAYVAMDDWLSAFAYRIEMTRQAGVFVLAGMAALVVALATVSYRAFRAATANPVDSLRNE